MPFKSKAQWRWAFAQAARGEPGPDPHKWAHETKKSFSKLPEHVGDTRKKKRKRRNRRAGSRMLSYLPDYRYVMLYDMDSPSMVVQLSHDHRRPGLLRRAMGIAALGLGGYGLWRGRKVLGGLIGGLRGMSGFSPAALKKAGVSMAVRRAAMLGRGLRKSLGAARSSIAKGLGSGAKGLAGLGRGVAGAGSAMVRPLRGLRRSLGLRPLLGSSASTAAARLLKERGVLRNWGNPEIRKARARRKAYFRETFGHLRSKRPDMFSLSWDGGNDVVSLEDHGLWMRVMFSE